MSRLSERMSRLELANPKSLPLDVRAWLGHALSGAERAELATLPAPGTYVPPTNVEMADWSTEARAWFVRR